MVNPSTGKVEAGDQKFRVSQDYIIRSGNKKKN